MARIHKTIHLNVPVGTAYNQWTQFEDFPNFMRSVEQVRQLDTSRLSWAASIGGEHKEWDALITRQVPDEVLAWKSESGPANSGTVVFKPVAPDRTEMQLHVEYEPEGMKEQLGSRLGFVSRAVSADLKRFKRFLERRGAETGAWRGAILHGQEALVAPLADTSDAPDPDQIRFGVSPLDSGRSIAPDNVTQKGLGAT